MGQRAPNRSGAREEGRGKDPSVGGRTAAAAAGSERKDRDPPAKGGYERDRDRSRSPPRRSYDERGGDRDSGRDRGPDRDRDRGYDRDRGGCRYEKVLHYAGTGLMRPFGASFDCNTYTLTGTYVDLNICGRNWSLEYRNPGVTPPPDRNRYC